MEYTTLSNGVEMPMLGYGVFQIGNAETEECVSEAIKAGYRLIDTAQSYGNEEGVGAAVAKSGVPREELFVVSKVWVSNYRYEDAKRSIDESLERLGLEYLDLMLLHQCYYDVYGAWRALEEAYAEGKVRAIGVSNFDSKQLMDLCAFAEVSPMLNQVETHVFWQEKPEHAVMQRLGVQHMAWGPFAEGANGFFTNPLLAKIGEKYGKGVGQVALRFHGRGRRRDPQVQQARPHGRELRRLRLRADRGRPRADPWPRRRSLHHPGPPQPRHRAVPARPHQGPDRRGEVTNCCQLSAS